MNARDHGAASPAEPGRARVGVPAGAGASTEASEASGTAPLAARPLVPAAAAVAVGSALGLGLAGEPLPFGLRAALGPACALALGLVLARRRPVAVASGASPGRGAPSLAARASLLLALAAAWRAAELTRPVQETVEPGRAARADDLERGWRAPSWTLAEGAFELDRGPPAIQADGTTRGLVGGLRFEAEGALAEHGEWVRVLSGEPPVPPPRWRPDDAAPPGASESGALHELRQDQVVRLAPADRNAGARAPPVLALARWRARCVARLAALDSPAAAALGPAVLFSERSGLAELSDLFTRTGTRHLLAVSGTHVALLALLVALPLRAALRAAGRSPRALGPWIALALAAYVPLAGQGAPVRRAALALALAGLAPLVPWNAAGAERDVRDLGLGRRADAASLLSLALLLELLADPRALGSIGVQLSYAATLGLLCFARPTSRALLALVGLGHVGRPRRAGAPPGWTRLVLHRTARATALALGTSLAATAATLPIVWAHFGEWSAAGIVLTPCALPLLAALLAAALGFSLAPGLVGPGAVAVPAELLARLVELGDRLPGTPAPLPERPVQALALLAAGLFCAGLARSIGAHPTARGAGRLAALGCAVLWLPWRPAPARLELSLLDVGHGTAVLARAPGLGVLVFDAGSRDRRGVAQRALSPWLARAEATRPTVVLSHADRDHASALDWLVERYPPRTWLGALPAPLDERLPHSCERLDLDPRGELVRSAGPVVLRLARGLAEAGNEGSRALELTIPGALGPGTLGPGARGGRVVLLGDAEGPGLEALLALGLEGRSGGPVELLLAPHHGSETPLLASLLERLRPRRVWISASAAPPIGPELDRRGLQWASTHRDGPQELELPSPGPALLARSSHGSTP